jgi:hypothetical protein
VFDAAIFQPRRQLFLKTTVGEILAPQRRIPDARFGQRTVQIQHADQSRPCPRPIRDGQDGPLVGNQAVQKVVRVLPNRFGDDQSAIRVDLAKDLHPFLLRADKAVFFSIFVRVGSFQRITAAGERFGQLGLHFVLRSPTLLVGGQAQIAVGHQQYLAFAGLGGFRRSRDIISRHGPCLLDDM